MFIFSLFIKKCTKKIDISRIDGRWKIDDELVVDTSHRDLGPSKSLFSTEQFIQQKRFYIKFDFIQLNGTFADEETNTFTGHVYIHEGSGLTLVDTQGELVWTDEILDIMESKFGVEFVPLQPPVEKWILFMKGTDLLDVLVATRWGLEDLVKTDEFDWSQLESKPLVSASIVLQHEGPFQIRVGSGLITVYDNGKEDRVEYVSQLVEKFLMNGENYLESQFSCK